MAQYSLRRKRFCPKARWVLHGEATISQGTNNSGRPSCEGTEEGFFSFPFQVLSGLTAKCRECPWTKPPAHAYHGSFSRVIVRQTKEFTSLCHFRLTIECQDALGMENGGVLDEQITASSELNDNSAAYQGRLNARESVQG